MLTKDYSISFIRVLASVMIVFCHICSYFHLIALAQFFDTGVLVFFLISGYLYGNKEILRPEQWLFKRYIRLEIPALIWLGIVCISAHFKHLPLPALHEQVFILLNLEGLRFIFPRMEDLFIGPWFFTNIMCCYLALVFYHKIEKKHKAIEKMFSYGGVLPLSIFVILAMLGISTDGLLTFFVGFVLKRRESTEKCWKWNFSAACAWFFCGIGMRLLGKFFIDETLLYNEAISPISCIMIATSILVGVKWAFSRFPIGLTAFSSSKAIQHLDIISIYTYICHDMLFNGTVLSVLDYPLSIVLRLGLLLLLIVAFSTGLWLIGNKATAGVEKAWDYLFA